MAEKVPYVEADQTRKSTVSIKPFAAEMKTAGPVRAQTGNGKVAYQNGHMDGSGDVNS